METSNRRVVLITGAARRVGACIAKQCHEDDLNIALHYNASQAEAQSLVDELNQARPNSAEAYSLDLKQISKLPTLVEQVLARWGRLDVLINNASTFYATPMTKASLEDWHDLIGPNLQAPFFLSQACAPHLKQAAGSIVNIVDIHGFNPLRQHPIYSIAKAGLIMLTKSLAKELAPEIRVNGIAPGAVLWPEHDNMLDTAMQSRIIEKTPLKRAGTPQDIAQTAAFLIHNAPFITGQIIPVDGGRSI